MLSVRYHPIAMSSAPLMSEPNSESLDSASGSLLKSAVWISAGLSALAIGLIVGRQIRQRYKFSRRTPYDAFSHAGDAVQDVEFGVGV